jgi:hypothetical protein
VSLVDLQWRASSLKALLCDLILSFRKIPLLPSWIMQK